MYMIGYDGLNHFSVIIFVPILVGPVWFIIVDGFCFESIFAFDEYSMA